MKPIIFIIFCLFLCIPVFSTENAGPVCSSGSRQEKTGLPPHQRETDNFPILHIGKIPDLNRDNWTLEVKGEVQNKIKMTWNDFIQMDTVHSLSDFHCVTGWSRTKNLWKGVRIRDILDKAGLKPKAKYVLFKAADGYSTNLKIEDCTGDDDILAFEWEGKPLPREQGGPVRVVIPEKYGYKSAMWVTEIVVLKKDKKGYWEKRGYSNSADPWKEERH